MLGKLRCNPLKLVVEARSHLGCCRGGGGSRSRARGVENISVAALRIVCFGGSGCCSSGLEAVDLCGACSSESASSSLSAGENAVDIMLRDRVGQICRTHLVLGIAWNALNSSSPKPVSMWNRIGSSSWMGSPCQEQSHGVGQRDGGEE